MLSTIDILIVSNEFLQRTPLYLITALVYFRDYFKVSICYKAILYELIKQSCYLLYHSGLIIKNFPFEPLLCLHDEKFYHLDFFPPFLEGCQRIIPGSFEFNNAFVRNFFVVDVLSLVDWQAFLAQRQSAFLWVRRMYS